MLFHELSPHKATCRVIWEWEINLLVKEFLEFLLRSFLWMTCAAQNSDTCLVVDEFGTPLTKSFLDSLWIGWIRLLLFATFLALLTFLFGRPDFLALIDVNDGWLVLFGNNHNRCHQLLLLFLLRVDTIDVNGTHVKDHGVSLSGTSSDYECLTRSFWTVEEE